MIIRSRAIVFYEMFMLYARDTYIAIANVKYTSVDKRSDHGGGYSSGINYLHY